MNTQKPPRILVIKFRHIGDVLLSSVLAKNLKEAYPNSRVEYLINAESKDMLTLNPYIDDILLYDRKKAKALGFFGRIRYEIALLSQIRERKYDIVINTTEGERGAYIAFGSKAPIRVGIPAKKGVFAKFSPYTHTFKPPQKHVVEANLDALRALGIEALYKKVELFYSLDDKARAASFVDGLGDFVQIHPTSRWLFKALSSAQNAEIIDYIEALGIKTVVTAAPDAKELKAVEEIISLCKSSPVNLAGKLTLKELAALSFKAKLFFGVDTAAMHIAASQNTPCVAVFGPSGTFEWGAWDNDENISGYTKRNGIQRMGKHTTLQVEWECAPCGKDGCDGSKKSKCLLEYPAKLITNEISVKLKADVKYKNT